MSGAASFLRRLLGGGARAAAAPAASEDHAGFRITPDPEPAPGGSRLAARIEKDGRSHRMIRADVVADRDEAVAASLRKARQVIDEQGDRLHG